MNRLLRPRELAELIGVPVSFIYDRTQTNSPDPIPHFKIGKYVRFALAEVEQWLEERKICSLA